MSLVEQKLRRDNWQEHEDIFLLETVVNYGKEGKSQLQAFEDAAAKLGRTPGACGFRFNNVLRKKFKDQLSGVKTQRGRGPGKRKQQPATDETASFFKSDQQPEELLNITWKNVQDFLDSQQKRIESLEREVSELRQENEMLRSETLFGEDYRATIHLLRRARDMGLSIMENDGKLTFQMSTGVNLGQIG